MSTELDSCNDEVLMMRIAEGDHSAFAALVRRHTKKFYSIAYRTLVNKEDVDDIVQEVFLTLWNKPEAWKREQRTKFTTWFYKVIVNKCKDANKKKKPLPMSETFEIEDTCKTVDILLEEDQRQSLVNKSIAALPEQQRIALTLCFYEGISNQEAADIMGLKLKALQSLLMRTKSSLKKVIHHATLAEDSHG